MFLYCCITCSIVQVLWSLILNFQTCKRWFQVGNKKNIWQIIPNQTNSYGKNDFSSKSGGKQLFFFLSNDDKHWGTTICSLYFWNVGIMSSDLLNRSFCAFSSNILMTFLCMQESCPTVKSILLLDSEGKRVAVKYYTDDWPTLSAKLALEKSVFTKTHKTNARTEGDMQMILDLTADQMYSCLSLVLSLTLTSICMSSPLNIITYSNYSSMPVFRA